MIDIEPGEIEYSIQCDNCDEKFTLHEDYFKRARHLKKNKGE